MAELRLMENCDIEECTELYLGAFHHDGKMGSIFGKIFRYISRSI